MRPHRLRVVAFGPFAGEVEVDLDRLAGSGLFLLHGETGAGKTTLLDALGFALYGRVPGARNKAGRLRSDHADPAVRTEVELEVTLGGQRWRVLRRPAQERPKARGTGTTTEQASVLLQVQDGDGWRPVSTRIDEASAELDRLLGMSAEQFFQVVLLPQGEFARFLRADSKERGELLQRLFATERFSAVQDWLAARRGRTAGQVAEARQQAQVVAARLAQAGGVDVPEPVDAGWGGAVLDALTAARVQAEEQVAAADQRRAGARDLAEQAARLAARQARRRAAEQELAALERGRPAAAALAEELSAAVRAAEVAPVLEQAAARERLHAAATSAEAAARAGLAAVGLPLASDLPELVAAGEQARRRSGRLDALRGVADDLARERGVAFAAERDEAGAVSSLGAVDGALAVLPARREVAQAAVAAAREAAERLAPAGAALTALRAAGQEARTLADALATAQVLREEHVLAREKAVGLHVKAAELREARFASVFAELADGLVDGVPCEVCGSTSHPDPYEGAGEGVTKEDEERARAEAVRADDEVAQVAARLAAVRAAADGARARLDALAAELGPDPAALCASAGTEAGADGLADALSLAEQEHAALRRAAAGRAAAEEVLAGLEREQARAETERTRLEGARDAAAARREETEGRAARLTAQLTAVLDGAPDLDSAAARTAATAAACDAVVEAVREAARAGTEATRAAAAALEAAAAAGFAGTSRAAGAVRSSTWRADAERRLREAGDAEARTAAALADPELDVPLEPPADVDAAQRALRAADDEVARATAAQAGAGGRADQVAVLVPELAQALEALAPLVAEADLARRLADLCAGAGANALKMTLTSFVLAARLEEVAAAASGRLLRMTQGRYALVHTDGAARGGVRSGLGLLARDSWTGRDRDTSTLSGGETFQASLALALGLADVVQAEAGGTRIEALFVDEGFGTLDEDTLDEVMDVLDGLREGGRVVGLVSHVAELRARIPAQVHVRKGRRGSELSVVGC